MPNVVPVSGEAVRQELLQASQPVLIDFSADRCAPCRQLEPILEEIAEEHAGVIRVLRVDADADPETAVHYEVQSIPTLILFVDGRPVRRLIGARGKARLLQELAEYLG